MTQPFRTPTGGQIDRSQTLHFTFDGKTYQAMPETRSPQRCSAMACG